MNRKIVFFFIIFNNLYCFSQDFLKKVPIAQLIPSPINHQRVSFTKFMETLVKFQVNVEDNQPKQIHYYDIEVVFTSEDRDGMDKRFSNPNAPFWFVKNDIFIENCKFDKTMWWVVNRLVFEGYFTWSGCDDIKTIFKDCQFKKTVRIDRNEIQFIDFQNCKFLHGYRHHHNSLQDYIKFYSCEFFINDKIQEDTRFSTFDDFVIYPRLFEIHQKTEGDVIIENSKFQLNPKLVANPKGKIDISMGSFSNLILKKSHFEGILNLSKTNVSNQFLLEDCYFRENIIIDAFNVNPNNTRIQWTNIKNHKLSVYDEKEGIISGSNNITNENVLNNLIASYANFYAVYKTQGNRIYANSCYVEWKDIETHFLKFKSEKQPEFYFIYWMNLFLKKFCDYGTNPLKSIYLSFWVLLIFAGLYFFSPYKQNDNDFSFFDKLKIYGLYFSEKISITQIFMEQYFSKLSDNTSKYIEFVNFTQHQSNLPHFFKLWALPYHWKQKFILKIYLKIYHWIDQFHEPWKNLSYKQKLKAIFIFGSLITFDFVVFITKRFLDSFTLSLNVFSTLGFGDIPIHGHVRYFTIIEGFIGWFLLSIFSVALLSQVIQ